MTDYTKLVKALRCCGNEGCHKCPYKKHIHEKFCWVIAMKDAAAAIEELQQIADHYEQTAKDFWKEACEYKAQLPKRGEWVEEDLDNFRKYKVTCPHCGAWFVGNYDAYDEPSDFLYCPHCGNICNPTNLDWENELKEREKEARAKMFASDINVLNKNDTTDGPIITPCRGCSDYDGYGGCKSKGGCARAKMEVQE